MPQGGLRKGGLSEGVSGWGASGWGVAGEVPQTCNNHIATVATFVSEVGRGRLIPGSEAPSEGGAGLASLV